MPLREWTAVVAFKSDVMVAFSCCEGKMESGFGAKGAESRTSPDFIC